MEIVDCSAPELGIVDYLMMVFGKMPTIQL
jgi:hypothetical protein